MTDEERASRRLADLQEFATLHKIKPKSTPPLERWTLPDDQAVPVSACLRDSGWAAEAGPNGYLQTTVEEAQRTAQKLAQYDCMARFSIDPRFLSQPTQQMYGAVWTYFKDYGIPCLARFDLAPDLPLPTRETFLATNGRWGLYPINAEVPAEVQAVCPQLPPTRAMFGLE
ncbi:MAG: hypothetical protein IPL43_10570 [Micropruina sp.]|nr:hypothetical protein [Micropruina sp.]